MLSCVHHLDCALPEGSQTVDTFLLSERDKFPSTLTAAYVCSLFFLFILWPCTIVLGFSHVSAPLLSIICYSYVFTCSVFHMGYLCHVVSVSVKAFIFNVPCALFLVVLPVSLSSDYGLTVLPCPTQWTLTKVLGPHNNHCAEFMHLLSALTYMR